jgi:HlyD family secretion protein
LALFSCRDKEIKSDASGTFESSSTIVSTEASGKILALDVNEGDVLRQGQLVGYVDSAQLHLSKLQLLQNKKAILSGRPDKRAQSESLESQIENAISDRDRIQNLVKGGIASQKQLDDANAKITVLKSQLVGLQSNLSTTTVNLNEQGNNVQSQLGLIEDQIRRCKIVNPVNGTVLTKYVNTFEMTGVGKPLYEIADLSVLDLRAYITADQFAKVKIGDKVKVNVDAGGGKSKTYEGIVSWISDKAEFTPKTIQTKDERANRVYAIKIRVHNDGIIKIGMFGEVFFS